MLDCLDTISIYEADLIYIYGVVIKYLVKKKSICYIIISYPLNLMLLYYL